MIRISGKSLHGKAYLWWKDHAYFKNNKNVAYTENLCHMFRVYTLWLPLRLAFQWTPLKDKDFEGFFSPVQVCVLVSLICLYGFFWVTAPFATLFWTLVVFGFIGILVADTYKQTIHAWWNKKRKRSKRLDVTEQDTRFSSMVWHFLKAKKRKICPLVEVVDDRFKN